MCFAWLEVYVACWKLMQMPLGRVGNLPCTQAPPFPVVLRQPTLYTFISVLAPGGI